MSQITQDIAELKAKYGTYKGIRTAEQIMRVTNKLDQIISIMGAGNSGWKINEIEKILYADKAIIEKEIIWKN